MRHSKNLLTTFLIVVVAGCSDSYQQADPDFKPQNSIARFASQAGPVVLVDEAHNNFLTISGRYKPFSQVLLSDGFRVKPNTKRFTQNQLKHADVVVIANALDKKRTDWLPLYGHALSNDEVKAIKRWILEGGSLLLIADHNPFPKTIENLAQALGFEFSNGHVTNATFSKTKQSLTGHKITYGKQETHDAASIHSFMQKLDENAQKFAQVYQVKSFGGSAFQAPENAVSLLNLGNGIVSIEPEIAFQVNSTTPRIPITGWSQGAVLQLGKGRIAVFSEGMMFSSQVDRTTGNKHGFRSAGAEQNEQFLLNVMYWLVGEI